MQGNLIIKKNKGGGSKYRNGFIYLLIIRSRG